MSPKITTPPQEPQISGGTAQPNEGNNLPRKQHTGKESPDPVTRHQFWIQHQPKSSSFPLRMVAAEGQGERSWGLTT